LIVFASACAGKQKRQLLLVLAGYIAGECALVCWKGYNPSTCSLIMGSGLLLILLYSVTGLVLYVKRMEHTRFENSMVYVYAALLFAYGSSLIIYIFAHYHPGNSNDDTDSFLLYYISLLLSAIVTSTGLWSYGIRKAEKSRRSMNVQRTPGYSSSSS
jgi:drug/metabolite transporter (DMT)-like permease